MEDPIRPESTDQVTSASGGEVAKVYSGEIYGAHVLTDILASYSAVPTAGLLTVKRDDAIVRQVHIASAGPHQLLFEPPLMGVSNEYLQIILAAGGAGVFAKLALGHYLKPTRVAGANKILNPGYEMLGAGGADIWANWSEAAWDGVIADETVLVHSGGHAAKLTAGASLNTNIEGEDFVVVPGTAHQLSFWARGDGTNYGRYLVLDISGDVVIIEGATGVPGTTYTQVSVPFTAPAGCVLARVYLLCPTINGGIAYFDDVSLVEVG